jgi:hypothetical protein
MKQLFLLFSVFASMQTMAQTPITLTRADFPKPTSSSVLPDSVLYTNVMSANTSAQTSNGASQIWNEWALTGTTAYQNFMPMSATPLVFQLAFLSCDFAQPLANAGTFGAGTTGGSLSDAYEYYDYSGSKLQIKGFGANVTISGVAAPLPALYTSPDVIYVFPIAYGNKDSSNSSFNVSLPLTLPAPLNNITITVKRVQKRVNEVDAWGAVTTPAGTFDVLRVVSKIDRIDSFKTSLFDIGTPSSPVEYKWLGAGKKVPVLQINGNDIAGVFTPTNATFWGESLIPAATQNMNTNLNSLITYPNPVIENTTISFSLKTASTVDVEVVSITGEKVAHFHFSKQAGNFTETLPLQTLKAGNYLISCKSGKEMVSSKMIKL